MTKPGKIRLDKLLAERGLAPSREAAQRLILAGAVRIAGDERRQTAGLLMAADAEVSVIAPEKFVSRGGLKLEAALDYFSVNPAGMICLDVGASTGGFTDCLLQRGAAKIFAVDVGRGWAAGGFQCLGRQDGRNPDGSLGQPAMGNLGRHARGLAERIAL